MEAGLIGVTRDKAKAKSILMMAEVTLEMIRTIDESKFASNLVKEYYDVIRELISAIMLLDGYKTRGEGAHIRAIEYMRENYKQLSELEISAIDDLREKRNRIAYNGFFVQPDYVARKKQTLAGIITKLIEITKKRV
ncbi:MAG: hypothetical protein NTU57_01955 [Candidatus Aenigmarchaeota archaeon]|nr:hypothetical protein [Candidatus Aenigmarchaeota archaeon]